VVEWDGKSQKYKSTGFMKDLHQRAKGLVFGTELKSLYLEIKALDKPRLFIDRFCQFSINHIFVLADM